MPSTKNSNPSIPIETNNEEELYSQLYVLEGAPEPGITNKVCGDQRKNGMILQKTNYHPTKSNVYETFSKTHSNETKCLKENGIGHMEEQGLSWNQICQLADELQDSIQNLKYMSPTNTLKGLKDFNPAYINSDAYKNKKKESSTQSIKVDNGQNFGDPESQNNQQPAKKGGAGGLNQKMKKLTSNLPHLFSSHHHHRNSHQSDGNHLKNGADNANHHKSTSTTLPCDGFGSSYNRDTYSNGVKASYYTLASSPSSSATPYTSTSIISPGGSLGRSKKSTGQQPKETQVASAGLKASRPASEFDARASNQNNSCSSNVRLLHIERRGSSIDAPTTVQTSSAGIGYIDSDASTSSGNGSTGLNRAHTQERHNGDVKLIYQRGAERGPNVAFIKKLPDLTPLSGARALEAHILQVVPRPPSRGGALKREDTLVFKEGASGKMDAASSASTQERYDRYSAGAQNQSIYGTIRSAGIGKSLDSRPSAVTSNHSTLPLYINPDNERKPLLFVPLSQNLPTMTTQSNNNVKVVKVDTNSYNKTEQLNPATTTSAGIRKAFYSRSLRDDEDAGIQSEMETSSTRRKDDNAILKSGSHPHSATSYHTLRTGFLNKVTGSDHHPNQTGIKMPTHALGGVIFMRYGQETKRIPIPMQGIRDVQDLHILFQKAFPKHLTMRKLEKCFKIYIQDNDSPKEIFYELEDMGDITNRSVLKLMETGGQDGGTQSPISDVDRDNGIDNDCENYYGSRYRDEKTGVNIRDERECDLSYFSEPEYNPNGKRVNYKPYANTNYNRFEVKDGLETALRDSAKYSSQIVTKSQFNDAERPLAKQLILRSNERLAPNAYQQSPSKFAKQKQVLDNMEARISERLYNSQPDSESGFRNQSQSISSRTESLPSWDQPDTKTKMDSMEQKLKVLTNMVQKALVKSPSPYHVENVADYRDHSLLSRSASLTTLAGLKSLQRKALEIKLDVKAVRDVTKIYVLDLNNLLMQTKQKILQICKCVPTSNLCKLSHSMRYSIDELDYFFEESLAKEGLEGIKKEIRVYHQDMSKLEKVLNDLEISVEECRNDIVNNKSQVQVADIESMALALSYASRAVSDLKNRYPTIEKILINETTLKNSMMVEEDRNSFNKERQIFLKIEPEKLENSLKRCKKLTATLYTLKKMATSGALSVNQSHPMLTGPSRSPSNQSLISMRSSNVSTKSSPVHATHIKLSLQSDDSVKSSPTHKSQVVKGHLSQQHQPPSLNVEIGHPPNLPRSKHSILPLLTLPYTPEGEECDNYLVTTVSDRNRNSAGNIPTRAHRIYSSFRSNASSAGTGGSCYSAGVSANDSSLSSGSARSSPVFGLSSYPFTSTQPNEACSEPTGVKKPSPLVHRTRMLFKDGSDARQNSYITYNTQLTKSPPRNTPEERDNNGLMETIARQLEDSISHLYQMGERGTNHSSSPLPYNLKDVAETQFRTGSERRFNCPSPLHSHHCTNSYDDRSHSSGRTSVLSTKSEPYPLRPKSSSRLVLDQLIERHRNVNRRELDNFQFNETSNDPGFRINSGTQDNYKTQAIAAIPPQPPKRNRAMMRSPVVSPPILTNGNLSPIKEMSPNNSFGPNSSSKKSNRAQAEENLYENIAFSRANKPGQQPLPTNLDELYSINCDKRIDNNKILAHPDFLDGRVEQLRKCFDAPNYPDSVQESNMAVGIARVHQPGERLVDLRAMRMPQQGVSTIIKTNRIMRNYERISNEEYSFGSRENISTASYREKAYSDTEDFCKYKPANDCFSSPQQEYNSMSSRSSVIAEEAYEATPFAHDLNAMLTNGSQPFPYKLTNFYNDSREQREALDKNGMNFDKTKFNTLPKDIKSFNISEGHKSQNEDSSSVSYDSQDDIKIRQQNKCCINNSMIRSTISDIGSSEEMHTDSNAFTGDGKKKMTSLTDLHNFEINVPPCAPPLPVGTRANSTNYSFYKQAQNNIVNNREGNETGTPKDLNVKYNTLNKTEGVQQKNCDVKAVSKTFTIPRQMAPGTFRQEFANIQRQLAAEAAQAKHNRQIALMNKRGASYRSDGQSFYQQVNYDTGNNSMTSPLSVTETSLNAPSSLNSERRSSLSSVKSIPSDGASSIITKRGENPDDSFHRFSYNFNKLESSKMVVQRAPVLSSLGDITNDVKECQSSDSIVIGKLNH